MLSTVRANRAARDAAGVRKTMDVLQRQLDSALKGAVLSTAAATAAGADAGRAAAGAPAGSTGTRTV